ncbi:putative zinc finger protein [Orchesella cincta]|uniref:Putative zinc finger protein n=1 Tax=Orchesella cincta TaxID=48709 RepID=A0A1D2N4H9_ORCCI|nr:putative zinc finger protein [Orchesella cincta]
MTDLIDLSTLSALGQHFSTVEDVAELKTMLGRVQDDLSAIKNFLTNEYGANFSSNMAANSSTKVIPVPVIKRLNSQPSTVNGGVREEQLKITQVVSMNRKLVASARGGGGQHSKPPPLLRFRGGDVVANRNDKMNLSNNTDDVATGSLVEVKKPERFQRNFLSMSSLKRSSAAASGVGVFKARTVVGSSYGSGLRGNGVVNQTIKNECESSSDIHEESFGPELKRKNVNIYNVRSINNDSYNLPEVDLEDVDDGIEGENYDDDAGQLEEDENVEFVMDDTNDQGGYDESSYMEIPEDGYNYEEDYSVDYGSDGLEIIDVSSSSSNFKAINQNSSGGGPQSQERAISKKAQQRRITMPDGDASLQKECKVCHEAVPSDALFAHVISTHYNGEIPTCNICTKQFTYRQGLISHMRYHDAEKYDKACSYCGKRFIRKSDVIIHERRLHTGERPYHCPAPDCNQGFVRRYCLLTHVKTNHGEPYMSQIMADAGKRRKSS